MAGSERVRRPYDAVVLAGAASFTTAAAYVVRDGRVSAPERAAFLAINHLPDGVGPILYVAQLVGVVGVLPGLAVAAAATRRYRLALALAVALPAKELIEHGVIKELVQRPRPAVSEPDAVLRYLAPSRGLAFPSGHAIVAVAAAGLLAPYLSRRARWGVAALAVLVCLARVYLGAHHPLDVLAGAAVGLSIASALNLALGVPGPGRPAG